jgi:dienelactone hydrolase
MGTRLNRAAMPILLTLGVLAGPVRSDDSGTAWGVLEPGAHKVGLRVEDHVDLSRPGMPVPQAPGDAPPPAPGRRVRVYLWYPAANAAASEPMRFDRYVELARDDLGPEWQGIRDLPLARGCSEARWNALLAERTATIEAASPASGPFPLVLVAQGIHYENPITHAIHCEHLASHGYVVATCPLVGTRSPVVSLDLVDLETEARDLEFVLSVCRRNGSTDAGRIGLLGFDLGGMAALLLAMRNDDVDALATMDAGILYTRFPDIPRQSPHYDVERMRIPWVHMTQARFVAGLDPEEDSDSLFRTAEYSDRRLLLFDGVQHQDFTSYTLYAPDRPVAAYWGEDWRPSRPAHETICRSVRGFFDWTLKGNDAGRAILDREPADDTLEESRPTRLARKARPAPISMAHLARIVLQDGGKSAARLALEQRKSNPAASIFEESRLNGLGYQLLYFWERPQDALEIFKLAAELHPDSSNVWDSLGEAHLFLGETDRARECYRKSLERNPENQNAKRVLDRIR